MRKIATLIGAGVIVSMFYTKHTYDQLVSNIMIKLYNNEELNENEKQIVESNIKLKEALEKRAAARVEQKQSKETIKNIIEQNK